MKYKIGFISNSSSSSFVIDINNITLKQYWRLINYSQAAPKIELKCDKWDMGWIITLSERSVVGSTSMDDFDMYAFLCKIGIPNDSIEWNDCKDVASRRTLKKQYQVLNELGVNKDGN